MAEVSKQELYTEKLMNMILDAVDDIIVIHDSEHTIIWMNRAAEKAFGKPAEAVVGQKCHALFGNSMPCGDCTVNITNIGRPTNTIRRRVIPGTDVVCDCSTIPYFEEGRLKLVVQHLRPVQCPLGERGRPARRSRQSPLLTARGITAAWT